MTKTEDLLREQERQSALQAHERLARADAIWHPSKEEYARIIDQWTYKPSPTIPKWLAIVGVIVAIACVLWTIHLLRGGLL